MSFDLQPQSGEFRAGVSLAEWCARNPPDWVDPHLYVLAQLARLIGDLHDLRMSPANLSSRGIMISPDGRPYMMTAPSADHVDFARDIIRYGAVAYEVLSGRPYVKGDEVVSLTHINPRVPLKIARLIENCFSSDAFIRPASIWLVEASLMDFLQMSGQMRRVVEWMKNPDPKLSASALAFKYPILKKQIELALVSGNDRAGIESMLNQFRALYPDDHSIIKMEMDLERPSKPARSWRTILFLLVIAFMTIQLFSHLAIRRATESPAQHSTSPDEDDSKTEAIPMMNAPAADF